MGCNQRRWDAYAVLTLKNKETRRKMNQINCEIKEHIRDWDPKHEKMSRGITLTEEEAYELSILLTG